VRDNDYVIGEFVWVAFDYLGEDGVWPKRGWDAGLLDMAGTPYPEYYLRKSYWSAEPVVHIAVEQEVPAKVNGIRVKLFLTGIIFSGEITCCPFIFIPTAMR
jgi:hypothetical protein